MGRWLWPSGGSACGTRDYEGLIGRIDAPNARTVRFSLCEADGADWALRVYRHAEEALTDKPGIKAWVDKLGEYFEKSSRAEEPAVSKP